MKEEWKRHARISDIRNGYEYFERILFIRLSDSSFDVSLDFSFSFLPMTTDSG